MKNYKKPCDKTDEFGYITVHSRLFLCLNIEALLFFIGVSLIYIKIGYLYFAVRKKKDIVQTGNGVCLSNIKMKKESTCDMIYRGGSS